MTHLAMNDIHFDRKADKFGQNIYQTHKGQLRLELIKSALANLLQGKPLSILDIGAGSGVFALKAAQQGHHVTLVEPSAAMLSQAVKRFEENAASARFVHASMQNFAPVEGYDLILCHAVLEWLADPLNSATGLKTWLNPGGHLSLAFYNKHALTFKHLMYGNLTPPETRVRKKQLRSLTPISPLEPETVYQWLNQQGFDIKDVLGIRTFSDYLADDVKKELDEKLIVEWETKLARKSPYRELARYIHVLGEAHGKSHTTAQQQS